MNGLPEQLQLYNCVTGHAVVAAIQALHREDAKHLIDADWWTDLGVTLANPMDEPDSHWQWREIISKTQNRPYFRGVCARSPDNKIQAAMLIRVDGRSVLAPGERAVLIDRLATAPRNRGWLVQAPLYRGGGEGLLAYAVAQSHFLGFSGRVTLFPIANEQFYLDRGFIRTDIIEDDEVLYELPAELATSMLQERGLI